MDLKSSSLEVLIITSCPEWPVVFQLTTIVSLLVRLAPLTDHEPERSLGVRSTGDDGRILSPQS